MSLPIEFIETDLAAMQLMSIVQVSINLIGSSIHIESSMANAIAYATNWCTEIWVHRWLIPYTAFCWRNLHITIKSTYVVISSHINTIHYQEHTLDIIETQGNIGNITVLVRTANGCNCCSICNNLHIYAISTTQRISFNLFPSSSDWIVDEPKWIFRYAHIKFAVALYRFKQLNFKQKKNNIKLRNAAFSSRLLFFCCTSFCQLSDVLLLFKSTTGVEQCNI